MIKVLVPPYPFCSDKISSYDLVVFPVEPDVPFYLYNERSYIGLSVRLHNWLKEYNIDYKITRDVKWYIVFENKKDAMYFKLTWE